MSGASKLAPFSNEIVDDFEDTLVKLKLLSKQLARVPNTNSPTTNAPELDARSSELKAIALKLEADQAKFDAKVLEWEANKDGELKAEKAKLEEEKSHLRHGLVLLKAAQSLLEEAIIKYESAQTQLEDAKSELEKTQGHLEAATTQTGGNNPRLRAAKVSLEASEMIFEAAGKELNDAKIKFEAAQNQLEVVISNFEGSGTSDLGLEEENKELWIQVCELERKLKTEQLDSKAKIQSLKMESGAAKVEQLKKENNTLTDSGGAEVERHKKNLQELQDELRKNRGVNQGNPMVFFDMDIRGVRAGRIVMELYADSQPRIAEVFRALCTGAKHLPGTSKLVGYKDTEIVYVNKGFNIHGGNVKVENKVEYESIYGSATPAEISSGKRTGYGDLLLFIGYSDDTNKSHTFLINCNTSGEQFTRFVVIGRVIHGMDLVNSINTGLPGGYLPKGNVVIGDCGQQN